MRPALSVILCTYNRATLLEGAVRALLRQVADTPPYEVIVVDNASTDGTSRLLAEWSRQAPVRLRILREPTPGLSYARNTGMIAAGAPLLAFTDDDVRVADDWVATMIRTFRRWPEASWVGGPVRPLDGLVRPVDADEPALGLQDHGPSAFFVGAGRPLCLIGANLGVRAEMVRTHGGFDPALQRVGDGVGSTEDHEFQERLWRHGLVGLYEPTLRVESLVDPARLTRRYQARWHFGHGRFVARMQVPEVEAFGGRRVLGVPAHLLRTAVREWMAGDPAPTWFAAGFARERLASGPEIPQSIRGLTSVVIPCFNQGRYLAEAVESALLQEDVEVIVVDDGSTVDPPVLDSRLPRVRLLKQANRGVAAARNNGLWSARGEFALFLDADDRLRPRAIARLRRALRAAPEAAFAFGHYTLIDGRGGTLSHRAPERREGTAFEALLRSNFICAPGTVLFRRESVIRSGGFSTRGVDEAADYDLYLRLARKRVLAALDRPILEYRTHEASMSARPDRMLAATLRVHARQRRHLTTGDRRRAWTEGRRFWREFYGNQLVDRIRARWRGRDLPGFLHDLAVLARWAPAVLLAHARRKFGRAVVAGHSTRYSTNRPSSNMRT